MIYREPRRHLLSSSGSRASTRGSGALRSRPRAPRGRRAQEAAGPLRQGRRWGRSEWEMWSPGTRSSLCWGSQADPGVTPGSPEMLPCLQDPTPHLSGLARPPPPSTPAPHCRDLPPLLQPGWGTILITLIVDPFFFFFLCTYYQGYMSAYY